MMMRAAVSSDEHRIVIVEDDPGLQSVLVRGLNASGFEALGVTSGAELLIELESSVPDAFVIDIGLPDTDGRDLCQAIRARGIDSPVLFLTAKDLLVDRLGGFAAGGDDYVTKPFELEEVAARLVALLRRHRREPVGGPGGLTLDPASHTASWGEERLSLTPTEFRVLAALAGRTGEAVRRRDLVRSGWPHSAIVHDNTLDAYIVRLRRKLKQLECSAQITTVHGVGYRFE
jgi:two-component system response regulator MprA